MFLNLNLKPLDSPALVDDKGLRISYGKLCDMALSVGACVPSRTVIFMLCKNSAEAVAGYLGFVEQEAVPVMLNDKIDDQLLNMLMELYRPSYLWCPEKSTERFSYKIIFRLAGYVLLETGNSTYPLHEKLQLCMTTSGSTGSPKLVRYKRGNLEANAKNVALAFGWTNAERSICDLQMSYTMGLNIINSHLYAGGTCLLTNHNLVSKEFWDFIQREKGTNFCGVPFSYDLLRRLHFENMELPDLTTITEGGGKLTDEMFESLADYAARTGKRFIASFGTTETSARMAVLPAELAKSKIGSIGKAIPEGELFLIDAEGKVIEEMPAEGELCYRGPNVTMGYAVCREDLQKGDEFNGVYRTGDLARRDEDGCYYVTGRLSRFLKLLSYRVSLDQCERLIQQEFRIECACGGNDRCMKIYVTDQSKMEDIINFISKKTGLYSSLFRVIVVSSIPRNESGKIQYKYLEELSEAD